MNYSKNLMEQKYLEFYINVYNRRQHFWSQCIFAYNTPNFGAINMKFDMHVYFLYTKNVSKKKIKKSLI